jgi:hypothetical protein
MALSKMESFPVLFNCGIRCPIVGVFTYIDRRFTIIIEAIF